MRRLPSTSYLAFPFRVGSDGALFSDRRAHVRELVLQVLFTSPGERVFRPDFGAGARALVFEPNALALRELASKRIIAALVEALKGEVDPRTLEVSIEDEGDSGETVLVAIAYRLAALGAREEQLISVGKGGAVYG